MDLTLIKAKAAVDSVPECRNKVSCADILAMATRDVIALVQNVSYILLLIQSSELVKKKNKLDK